MLQEHKDCSLDYNTGLYSDLANAPLAEQKNSIIRGLEAVVANMTQTTCLFYMRWFLAELNRIQDEKNGGTCFWAR
jgi:hypothetical protein